MKTPPTPIDLEAFRLLRDFINRKSGIYLSDSKAGFLEARLAKRISDLGCRNLTDYYLYLTSPGVTEKELPQLLDLVATNKTSFFREPDHFTFLEQVIFPIIEQKRIQDRRFFLRIWSAGCSSGEEAYSLAIALREYFGSFTPSHGRILATDISVSSLSKAAEGIYTSKETRDVPEHILSSHFRRIPGGREPRYQVRDHLKELVEFHNFNLMAQLYPFRYPFDIVFCRNVLIYFDRGSQEHVLTKIHGVMKQGGYLFTGMAENLISSPVPFRSLKFSIFVKE